MPDAHTEVIARGILIHHTRVLVCRNVKHGYCYLPGGHVEFAERASAALAREINEELGLTSRIGEFLFGTEEAFETKSKIHHEVNLVFHVEQLGDALDPPAAVPSREPSIAFEWIELAALHETDLRPATIKAYLLTGGDDAARWITGTSLSP